jgi:hypothetical protein
MFVEKKEIDAIDYYLLCILFIYYEIQMSNAFRHK